MREYKTKDQLYTDIRLLTNKVKNILQYIKENPTSDPNAFEMNDLMFEVSNVGCQGRKFEENNYDFMNDEKYKNLKDSFMIMMDYRMNQFEKDKELNCGSLNDYFNKSLYFSATLSPLAKNDKEKEIMNSLCGVNLYIHQRARDITSEDEIIYDNADEYQKINQGLENSSKFVFNASKQLEQSIYTLKEEIDQSYLKKKSNVATENNNHRKR